jgi:hypothetical protein
MSRKTVSPAIPEGGEDAVQALKESMEVGLGRRGNELERFVTFRDLTSAGMVVRTGRGLSVTAPGAGGDAGDAGDAGSNTTPGGPIDFGQNDLTKPPRPSGVRARGLSMSSIGVTWAPPAYNSHKYAEVFASKSDNWAHIQTTFDLNQPVGQGNSTPYYMGSAVGNTFLHRNLEGTIPSLQVRFTVTSINAGNGATTVNISSPTGFKVGDTVYFLGNPAWPGNGYQATVTQTLASGVVVDIELPGLAGETFIERVPEQDELAAAVNPDPVYYWVRFVSQANVTGDVQSEAGVVGTVFIDPERVLDIMTGRIRMSNLASDIITPINYVKGPLIPRLDGIARDMEEIDGNASTALSGVNSLTTTLFGTEENPAGGKITKLEGFAAEFDKAEATNLAAWIEEINLKVTKEGATVDIVNQWQASFTSTVGTIENVASRIFKDSATATATEATIDALDAYEATFSANNSDRQTGWNNVLGRVVNRKMVKLTDTEAIAHIGSTLQLTINGTNTALNQIGQTITTASTDAANAQQRVNNAITLKVQQDSGGIWTTAGFGIGLQGDPANADSLRSTFAVAADQFAITSPGLRGRKVTLVRPWGTNRHRIEIGQVGTSLSLHYPIGQRVTIVVPPGDEAWKTALRGRTFRVVERGYDSIWRVYNIVVEKLPEDDVFTPLVGSYNVADQQVGIFHEQAIPFAVDTATGTVGIRGRLVVDGLIRADEADITDLAATQVWSQNITNYGLLNSKSIIGEAIATNRVGGWAVRIKAPNAQSSQNRVLEFSRWMTTSDDLPAPNADGRYSRDPSSYVQLNNTPDDTVFYIGTKENSLGQHQGMAYMRGSVLVDGSSRIVNQTEGFKHFTQMDSQFPIMVMDFAKTTDPGLDWMSNTPWDEWNYGTGAAQTSRMNWVRQNAFFWIDKEGQAGFNTPSSAIYLNDNPLELPASSGSIKVIRRLGAQSNIGRVFVSVTFEVTSNRSDGRDRLGIWYELFIVPTSLNYQTSNASASNGITYRTWTPGQRAEGIRGDFDNIRGTSTFVNTHFVIIRANNPGLPAQIVAAESSPGKIALEHWRNEHRASLYSITGHYCNATTPTSKTIAGSIRVPAGSYKALVVATEIFGHGKKSSSTWLYGTPDPVDGGQDNERGGINILGAHIHSQQTSDRDGF